MCAKTATCIAGQRIVEEYINSNRLSEVLLPRGRGFFYDNML